MSEVVVLSKCPKIPITILSYSSSVKKRPLILIFDSFRLIFAEYWDSAVQFKKASEFCYISSSCWFNSLSSPVYSSLSSSASPVCTQSCLFMFVKMWCLSRSPSLARVVCCSYVLVWLLLAFMSLPHFQPSFFSLCRLFPCLLFPVLVSSSRLSLSVLTTSCFILTVPGLTCVMFILLPLLVGFVPGVFSTCCPSARYPVYLVFLCSLSCRHRLLLCVCLLVGVSVSLL